MKTLSALLTPLALAATAFTVQAQTPPLKLDVEHITVSGLSSGGYMANQFHLAYSDWVNGVGILAAGPYYCAENDITTALGRCVDKAESPIDVAKLTEQAKTWAAENKIAPLDNLKGDRVWLFHGTRDVRVNKAVSDALAEQYKALVPAANVTYVNNKPVGHLFPTVSNGGQCMMAESPYIGNCDYDAAGELLNFILEGLAPASETLSGEVITFDQKALAGDDAETMAEKGYAYIPASCAEGETCQVHISFHGCNQYAEAVGMAYVEKTGLNNWADANNMVVVYPQTRKSLFMPLNPQGCWDWWGYTGDDYATKNGKQLKAVRNIVLGLSSN